MSYKAIFITNKSYLSYSNNSILIKNDFNDASISIDDIDSLIIENSQTVITTALIVALAQANVAVIYQDEKFMPAGISIGVNKNSRVSRIQKRQLSIKKPKHNQLWKQLVSSKILNQADVLKATSKRSDYLYSLANRVKSGDKDHVESIAAAYYFKELFGIDFNRRNDSDIRNAYLNYGYSIIRSAIARSIVGYGLNPSFGIWHDNELNAFNLADDFLEPFRPVVDYYVYHKSNSDNIEMDSQGRRELASLLYSQVVDENGCTITVKQGCKNIVSSYQSICHERRDNLDMFFLGIV